MRCNGRVGKTEAAESTNVIDWTDNTLLKRPELLICYTKRLSLVPFASMEGRHHLRRVATRYDIVIGAVL